MTMTETSAHVVLARSDKDFMLIVDGQKFQVSADEVQRLKGQIAHWESTPPTDTDGATVTN